MGASGLARRNGTDDRPRPGLSHPRLWPDPTFQAVCIPSQRDANDKGSCAGGRKLCPMGRVEGTKGASPGEEEVAGSMSPPEGKRLHLFCGGRRAGLGPRVCHREAGSSPRVKSAVWSSSCSEMQWLAGAPCLWNWGDFCHRWNRGDPCAGGKGGQGPKAESSPTVRSSSSGSTGRVQPMEVSRAVT